MILVSLPCSIGGRTGGGGGHEMAVLTEAQPEAAGGDLGGVVAGPVVQALPDRPPAALLGFLVFHSSIILIFFPSQSCFLLKRNLFSLPFSLSHAWPSSQNPAASDLALGTH